MRRWILAAMMVVGAGFASLSCGGSSGDDGCTKAQVEAAQARCKRCLDSCRNCNDPGAACVSSCRPCDQ